MMLTLLWFLSFFSVESLLRSCSALQDKLKRMELELEEEKSSVEMLTDRVSRSRDQIDQLRSELMQERSSKQDLELDKNAMERHVRQPALVMLNNTTPWKSLNTPLVFAHLLIYTHGLLVWLFMRYTKWKKMYPCFQHLWKEFEKVAMHLCSATFNLKPRRKIQ